MPDIDVVGSGFVPMVPGVWANTTIPAQQEDAPVLPAQDAPNVPSEPREQDVPPSITPALEASQPSPTPKSTSKNGE